MANVIVGGLLLLAVGAAVAYIVRAKKRGVKCIGCPGGKSCGGCGGCGGEEKDKNHHGTFSK